METVPLLSYSDLSDNEDTSTGLADHSDKTNEDIADPVVGSSARCDHIYIDINDDDGGLAVFEAPALPEAKQYHLYVCYATEDRDRAFEIVEELESRNVKCMFADRDFQPGKEIRVNIMEGINNSLKILTILSPRFAESRYCLHESDIAFQKQMETGLNYVIPVLLEPCEVPYGLKPKTYIDQTLPGMTVSVVADRIISALRLPETEDPMLSSELLGTGSKHKNGYYFEIEAQKNQCCWTKPAGFQFYVTADTEEKMGKAGFTVSRKLLRIATSFLNNHNALSDHVLFKPWKICMVIVCTVPFVFFLMGFFWYFLALIAGTRDGSRLKEDTPAGSLMVSDLTTTISLAMIAGICGCFGSKWMRANAQRKAKQELWTEVNVVTYKEGILFCLLYHEDIPVLRVMRYDVNRCERHIIELLRRKHRTDSFIERDASEIIERWLKKLCDDPLFVVPPAPTNRHNVLQDKMCICQLEEYNGSLFHAK